MYIVTPDQMKAAEAAADKKGVSYLQLMENAGKAVYDEILKIIPSVNGVKALVFCGKGNNGGDGFVIARHLAENNAFVTIVLASDIPSDGIARQQYDKITDKDNISVIPIAQAEIADNYDIIIDAVFGTGFHGTLPENLSEIFGKLSRSRALKIAVDIPSGADSINGACSESALKCDITVTFAAIKTGMLLSPAKSFCGKIITADIGISNDCFNKIGNIPVLMNNSLAADAIPVRNDNSHKGCFGKLLIIAGSDSMSGAAAMNTIGALRSGAGLVKLFSVPSVINRVGSSIYECTFHTAAPTPDGFISKENIPVLEAIAGDFDCISVGSGMGNNEDTAAITERMIQLCGEKNIPLIIDADGLNSIADRIDIIRNSNCPAVLTPHPRELGRLLGTDVSEVLSDRLAAAQKLARLTNAVICAKGMPTYIVSPDDCYASYTGNGGLSRGGSGDVLTGIISGIVTSDSRSLTDNPSLLTESAAAGVYVFGLSADIAAKKLSMTGMLPTDAANSLPEAYRQLGR